MHHRPVGFTWLIQVPFQEVEVGAFVALVVVLADFCQGFWWRDDHFLADGPVDRQGDGVFIGRLKGDEEAFHFFNVAAHVEWVVDDGADGSLGVNDKHRAHCRRGAFTGMEEAIGLSHFGVEVGNDGEVEEDIGFLFHVLHPGEVGVDGVDADADEFGVVGIEEWDVAREFDEFGGAHGREVSGVGEEDDPAVLVEFAEVELSFCGHRGEIGGGIADARDSGGCWVSGL